jgi:hypothetical protein
MCRVSFRSSCLTSFTHILAPVLVAIPDVIIRNQGASSVTLHFGGILAANLWTARFCSAAWFCRCLLAVSLRI